MIDCLLKRLRYWENTPNEGDPMVDALLSDITGAADRIEALTAALEKADALADAHDANRSIEDIDVALQGYRAAREAVK